MLMRVTDTPLKLVHWLTLHDATPPFPHKPFWRAQGRLYRNSCGAILCRSRGSGPYFGSRNLPFPPLILAK